MKNFFYKLALSASVFASTQMVFAQKSDAKSKSILDAVSNNYKFKKNIYFKFSYGTGSSAKVSKTQTGIFYSTPSQFKLKIMGIEQIFDGKKVYNISDEDKEVTIAKADGDDAMFSPTSYLNSYKKDFNTTYIGKRNLKGLSTDVIKMTPIKNNGISEVLLYINSTKKQISKIEQYGSDKNISVIEITAYKENQNLDPAMFTFNKANYKNYIITDL